MNGYLVLVTPRDIHDEIQSGTLFSLSLRRLLGEVFVDYGEREGTFFEHIFDFLISRKKSTFSSFSGWLFR